MNNSGMTQEPVGLVASSEADEEFRTRYGIGQAVSEIDFWLPTVSLLLQIPALIYFAATYQVAGCGAHGDMISNHLFGTIIAVVSFILAVIARKRRGSRDKGSLVVVVLTALPVVYGVGLPLLLFVLLSGF